MISIWLYKKEFGLFGVGKSLKKKYLAAKAVKWVQIELSKPHSVKNGGKEETEAVKSQGKENDLALDHESVGIDEGISEKAASTEPVVRSKMPEHATPTASKKKLLETAEGREGEEEQVELI